MTTDALAYLFSLERLGMKFGLETISRLCAALGHPERAFESILVAGTNGKGSVTAMVHSGLVAAGYHAARYTSPHLERIEERFVVGDREASAADIEATAEVVRAAVADLVHARQLEGPPTFFEAVTALAFELFRRAGVRIAVLEVGLGGRLDATNVVSPLVAAITSVDFDHEAHLGPTLESIALEKAGIVKPGIPVVCGRLAPEAEAVVRQVCAERSARFVSADAADDRVDMSSLALRGVHQQGNARVAVRILRELDALGMRVDDAAIRAALSGVDWPGRLELFHVGGREVLLDAAHNPAGARALATYIDETGWSGCALVFGALQDKNVSAMLDALAPVCGAVICTSPQTPRALPAGDVAHVARAVPHARWTVETIAEPREALSRSLSRHPRVVVAGSIFLIGPVRGILRSQ